MSWEQIGVLVSAAGMAGAGILALWSWIHNRHSSTETHVDQIDGRLTAMEARMEGLPSPSEIADLRVDITGKMASVEASLEAVSRSVRRVEDYLISGGGR